VWEEMGSGRTMARIGLRNDAAVSIVPPKIPDGEFSSIRLQGRYVRRCLPVDCEFFASRGLLPSFVHLAASNVVSPI
jgi:hypothetical protein